MHKKRSEICICCRVSEAKFYLYHSTKIANARPGFDDQPEHPSVKINSSSPCLDTPRNNMAKIEIVVDNPSILTFCSMKAKKIRDTSVLN